MLILLKLVALALFVAFDFLIKSLL